MLKTTIFTHLIVIITSPNEHKYTYFYIFSMAYVCSLQQPLHLTSAINDH